MPLFQYSYKWAAGSGNGYYEGESIADVKKRLEADIRDGETDDDKVKKLVISITEVEQPESAEE